MFLLREVNFGEGLVPQDEQALACYLAPCADALEVLPGAEYRATSKHRVGAVPWWKQGSTRLQVFMKSMWYGAGSVLGLGQDSTRVRTSSTILLAIWDLLLIGMWCAVLGRRHMCGTYAQDIFICVLRTRRTYSTRQLPQRYVRIMRSELVQVQLSRAH